MSKESSKRIVSLRPANKPPDSGPFSPGNVLEGKFRIEHLIGKGAMGEVYLAWDLFLRRHVAVKVLADEFYDDETIGSFRSEAEAMASVRHDNVVQIYSFGEELGQPYFVMEYIDGNSLSDVIERRVQQQEFAHVDEAIGLLAQACRGLHSIHQAGIVHRDVKPANILITKRYRVAVADFGLVSPTAETPSGESFRSHGTPMYMAPERIRGIKIPKNLAHLCDIYALGVILFELLTNVPPFDSDVIVDLLEMHVKHPVPAASRVRPELPPAIDKVIAKAMAKQPADRYQTPLEVLEALRGARDRSYTIEETHEAHTFVVIDPDAEHAAKLIRTLRLAYPRCTIVTATNCDDGLTFIREMQPQVVLVDSAAPGISAHELCDALQKDRDLKQTKILVLASSISTMERNYLKEMGVVDVMRKPLNSAALLTAVRSVR